jgi:hypothetical protein
MKPPIQRMPVLFILAVFLCACELRTIPAPTDTPVPPTSTQTLTATPISSSTPTTVPTFTRKPSSSPAPQQAYSPVATLAISPTPVPGWTTYTNDYLGYSFNYPDGGKITGMGPRGMDANEVIPPGFTFDEYFDYVKAILPDSLCVILQIPGVQITITPPYDPLGSYVAPCPGMGVGSQYRMVGAEATWWMAGREYRDSQGTRLYLKDTSVLDGEFYVFNLENGFRVVYNGMLRGEMSLTAYESQKSIAREILATLHWFRLPDLTKPGTTCAGKYTRLVPGESAIVTGASTGLPDRVRSGPSLSDEILTQIYPKSIVKVAAGPVCADGLVFWRLENVLIPGGSGWAAEGDGTEYWLEPVKP